MDPYGDQQFTISRLHSGVQRRQCGQRMHEAAKKRDWRDAFVSVLGSFRQGTESVRPESSEHPQYPDGTHGVKPGGARGAHDNPLREDAADGEEITIRVPHQPPEPGARLITEHEFDGARSVQKLVSLLRSVNRSSARSRFPRGKRVAPK